MHAHAHSARQRTHSRLLIALVLTLLFVIAEITAGYLSNSLALLTDALHNVTDVAALALTWYAFRQGARPAHSGKTFGYHRVGILAALINSTTLTLIAAGIFFEAYQRLLLPQAVDAEIVIPVASAAVVINLITAWLVSHDADHDLNLRSAFIHLLGDVFSSAGAVLAGIAITLTGLYWFDSVASTLIGLLILWNAWLVLRETVDILLESSPRDIEVSTLVRDLLQTEGVRGLHDLHVWSLSRNLKILQAHVFVDDMLLSQTTHIREELERILLENYGIRHVTLQFEFSRCAPDALYCDIYDRGIGHDARKPAACNHDHD